MPILCQPRHVSRSVGKRVSSTCAVDLSQFSPPDASIRSRCRLGCRSGKARRRNRNCDGQSGRSSSVQQRQYFSEHGRQIPQSSLHGLDTFGERGDVLESAAILGQNRGCVWKDYPVSGETGNHCHKRLTNYYQVMRLIPNEPSNETMKATARRCATRMKEKS